MCLLLVQGTAQLSALSALSSVSQLHGIVLISTVLIKHWRHDLLVDWLFLVALDETAEDAALARVGLGSISCVAVVLF